MGADSSKYGSVKITLDKYIFTPGEAVSGMINVIINEAIPPCQVQLGFKGVEEIRWTESQRVRNRSRSRSSSSQYRTRTVIYYNKVIISRTKYVIASYNQPLVPGSFAIPFTFITPQGIPGSFFYNGYRSMFGVVYKFYVRLMAGDVKLKDKQGIGIINEYPINRIVQPPASANLKAWCFFSKGTTTLDIKWVNDVYSTGNPIQCLLSVDNTLCKVRAKSISAHVYFVIIATANSGRTKHFPITVFKNTFEMPVEVGEKETATMLFRSHSTLKKLRRGLIS